MAFNKHRILYKFVGLNDIYNPKLACKCYTWSEIYYVGQCVDGAVIKPNLLHGDHLHPNKGNGLYTSVQWWSLL